MKDLIELALKCGAIEHDTIGYSSTNTFDFTQKQLAAFAEAIRAEQAQRIAELEAAVGPNEGQTVRPNSQDWTGMDGATAFLLINRHADGWADIRLMMDEWLSANSIIAASAQDAARFAWLDENRIDWLPPGYNGDLEGRFDMYWPSRQKDLRIAIDEARRDATP